MIHDPSESFCQNHDTGKIVRECPECRKEAFIEVNDRIVERIKDIEQRIDAGTLVISQAEQQLKILRKKLKEYERLKDDLFNKNPELIKYLEP